MGRGYPTILTSWRRNIFFSSFIKQLWLPANFLLVHCTLISMEMVKIAHWYPVSVSWCPTYYWSIRGPPTYSLTVEFSQQPLMSYHIKHLLKIQTYNINWFAHIHMPLRKLYHIFLRKKEIGRETGKIKSCRLY